MSLPLVYNSNIDWIYEPTLQLWKESLNSDG